MAAKRALRRKREPTDKERKLGEIVRGHESTVRKLARSVERELRTQGLLEAFPREAHLQVGRVVHDGSTYVVTRVPAVIPAPEEIPARQGEVADLLLDDQPRKTIAARLGISIRTVDSHVERLFARFGVASTRALVRVLSLMK
jgi:DNA-binding CsgD family transcriptional regulator